jgi:hypothetical protein
MWWILIWLLLFVLGGLYLGKRTWGLWGQTKELGSELATAQRRLDEVQGQLVLLGERISSPEDLAVFATPAVASKQRDRARATGRKARQQRRAVSRPAWAKHVD